MRLIYQHLRELGHRNIGYVGVGGNEKDPRFPFLLNAMADYGEKINSDHFFSIVNKNDESYERIIESILRLKSRPTALICYNDWIALKIMHQAQISRLNIPDELSLTGFDDLFTSRLIQVPLTTVRFPIRETAKKAIRILFESDFSKFLYHQLIRLFGMFL